jgi:Holliday junction DNA helicase RuvA
VIAKLRRKMPKFALLVRRDLPGAAPQPPGVIEETFQALLVLGHHESEARRLMEQAMEGGKKYKDTEAFLQAIYQKQTGQ